METENSTHFLEKEKTPPFIPLAMLLEHQYKLDTRTCKIYPAALRSLMQAAFDALLYKYPREVLANTLSVRVAAKMHKTRADLCQ